MVKLRNALTDVGMFTQYLARKCVIHSPQAELDMTPTEREGKGQRFGTNEHYEGSKVHMLHGIDGHQFVAVSPRGRMMRVTVEEIGAKDLEGVTLAAVGK